MHCIVILHCVGLLQCIAILHCIATLQCIVKVYYIAPVGITRWRLPQLTFLAGFLLQWSGEGGLWGCCSFIEQQEKAEFSILHYQGAVLSCSSSTPVSCSGDPPWILKLCLLVQDCTPKSAKLWGQHRFRHKIWYTKFLHPEITKYIITWISRLYEFSEGEDGSEGEGSKVHCYSAVVKCTVTVQL